MATNPLDLYQPDPLPASLAQRVPLPAPETGTVGMAVDTVIQAGGKILSAASGSRVAADENVTGVARRAGTKAIAPSLGSLAGAGAGAEAGTIGGAAFGPIGAGIGAVGGGLLGAFGGGYLIDRAQDAIIPDRLKQMLGWDLAQQAADEAAHPYVAFGARLVPQALTMGVSRSALQAGLGAAIGGGTEAGTEYAQGGTVDPLKVAAATAFGAALGGDPNRAGHVFFGGGQRAVQAIRDIPIGGRTAASLGARETLAAAIGEGTPTHDDAALVATVVSKIGEHLTPDERAAIAVLQHDTLVHASSPFEPGPAGDQEHGARLAATTAAIETGQALPDFAPKIARGGSYSGDEAVAARMIALESGGNPNARNPFPGQTAGGLGGITDASWKAFRAKDFGETPDQAMAVRGDPAAQRATLAAMVREERATLGHAGLPVTDGNVRLLHWLGPKGVDVLRADPATPIEALVPHKWVEVNPQLRGRTAGEIAALTDRQMGGVGEIARRDAPPSGEPTPVWDEQPFDDPSGLRLVHGSPNENLQLSDIVIEPRGAGTKQGRKYGGFYASDETDLSHAEGYARMANDGNGAVYDVDLKSTAKVETTNGDITRLSQDRINEFRSRGVDVVRGKDPRGRIENAIINRDAIERLAVRRGQEAVDHSAFLGASDRSPPAAKRTTPQAAKRYNDVLSFLAGHGGIADTEGHALTGQRNLQRTIPGVGKLIREGGMSLDEAGELLWERGWIADADPDNPAHRPTTADVLDLIERGAREPVRHPADEQDRIARSARDESDRHYAAATSAIDGVIEAAGERGVRITMGKRERDYAARQMAHGLSAEDAIETVLATDREELAGVFGVKPETLRLGRGYDEGADPFSFFDVAAADPEALVGYDDPAGATPDADSMWHDVAMLADEGDDAAYDFGEAEPMTLKALIEALDEEDQATAAVRACAAPGGGETA